MKPAPVKLTKDLKKLFVKSPWIVALVIVNDFEDGDLKRTVRVVGPAAFRDLDSAVNDAWDFEIAPNPELSMTQIATACALARPDLSYYQIAKLCHLTAGAVSKAMKPYLSTCPCCAGRVRPTRAFYLTPAQLKQSPKKVKEEVIDASSTPENGPEDEF